MKRLLDKLDTASRISLGIGIVLMFVAIPLPTWMAFLMGLVAAGILGFVFPEEPTRSGVLVAAPILGIGYLFGIVRGFSMIILAVLLIPSLIAPVWLARQAASVRRTIIG